MGDERRGEEGAAEVRVHLDWGIEHFCVLFSFKLAAHGRVVTENNLGPAGPIIRTFLDELRSVVEAVDESAFRVERLDRRVAFSEADLAGHGGRGTDHGVDPMVASRGHAESG